MLKKRGGFSFLEADAAECFKITNYSFGSVSSQSSEPSQPEGTGNREEGSRESSPLGPVIPARQGFCSWGREAGDNEDKRARLEFGWLAAFC